MSEKSFEIKSLKHKFREECLVITDEYEEINENDFWFFRRGYCIAQKETKDKINELGQELSYYKNGTQIKEIYVDECKLIDLQQKLDTYIQLAETKGKELEEAISIIKLIYEATSISAYIVSKEKIREFLNKLEKWK